MEPDEEFRKVLGEVAENIETPDIQQLTGMATEELSDPLQELINAQDKEQRRKQSKRMIEASPTEIVILRKSPDSNAAPLPDPNTAPATPLAPATPSASAQPLVPAPLADSNPASNLAVLIEGKSVEELVEEETSVQQESEQEKLTEETLLEEVIKYQQTDYFTSDGDHLGAAADHFKKGNYRLMQEELFNVEAHYPAGKGKIMPEKLKYLIQEMRKLANEKAKRETRELAKEESAGEESTTVAKPKYDPGGTSKEESKRWGSKIIPKEIPLDAEITPYEHEEGVTPTS